MTEETFSEDVVRNVEQIVRDIDACRVKHAIPAGTSSADLAAKFPACDAEIKALEAEISVVRGGRAAHHRGVGVVKPLG